eukprot:3007661-Amphidinium_carterae.5
MAPSLLSASASSSGLGPGEPMFAAIMDRHVVATGVRTLQGLESVLGLVVAIEAEIEAILQDQGPQVSTSSRNNPKAHAGVVGGTGGSSQNKPSDRQSTPEFTPELCKAWNTAKGCKFGKSCKFKHPYAKVTEGLCFVCGAKEQNSKSCPYSSNKPGSTPKGGKDGGGGKKGSEKDKGRSGSQSCDAPRSGSGNRSKEAGRPSGGKQGDRKGSSSVPKSPSAKSAGDSLRGGGEGLLDSGASHVIAPLEELPESDRAGGQRVALALASGKPTDSVTTSPRRWCARFGLRLSGLGKVYVSLHLKTGSFLGNSIPVCETTFSVREDNIDVHGKSIDNGVEPHVSQDEHEGCLSELQEDRFMNAVERLTCSADRLVESLDSCRLVAQSSSVATSIDVSSAKQVSHDDSSDVARSPDAKLASAQDTCAPVAIANAATRNTVGVCRKVSERVEAYLIEHGVPSTSREVSEHAVGFIYS